MDLKIGPRDAVILFQDDGKGGVTLYALNDDRQGDEIPQAHAIAAKMKRAIESLFIKATVEGAK